MYELHLGFLSHRLSQRGASWVSRPPDSYMLSVNPLRHLPQVRPIWHFPKYSNQPLVFPAWNYEQSAGEAQEGGGAEQSAREHSRGVSAPSTQPHLYFRNYRNPLLSRLCGASLKSLSVHQKVTWLVSPDRVPGILKMQQHA